MRVAAVDDTVWGKIFGFVKAQLSAAITGSSEQRLAAYQYACFRALPRVCMHFCSVLQQQRSLSACLVIDHKLSCFGIQSLMYWLRGNKSHVKKLVVRVRTTTTEVVITALNTPDARLDTAVIFFTSQVSSRCCQRANLCCDATRLEKG